MLVSEMASEERAQKFHTDDASLPSDLGSASGWMKQFSALVPQMLFPGETSDGSQNKV